MRRLVLLLLVLSSAFVHAADEDRIVFAKPSSADQDRHGRDTIRAPGRCSMYDTCGSSGMFGPQLPCVDNSPARQVDDSLNTKLLQICGPPEDGSDRWNFSCCTEAQLDNLESSVSQAEPLIALCPACKLNFRSFYCSFTCSPDQSEFVTVTETQDLGGGNGGGPAVKELSFHVDESFGGGFFDSCKGVKFGATNGYAMEFLGGGAKNWISFLRYMGQKRPGLGSPFQINFPQPPNTLPGGNGTYPIYPLTSSPLSCSSEDPNVRCACLDCQDTCLELPHVPSPEDEKRAQCHVGLISCFSFSLIIVYAFALTTFFLSLFVNYAWRHGHSFSLSGLRIRPYLFNLPSTRNGYTRLALDDPEHPDDDGGQNETSLQRTQMNRNPLVGSSNQDHEDPHDATEPSTSSADMNFSSQNSFGFNRLDRGHSLLDPFTSNQPRSYVVNTYLSPAFYKLGLFCGNRPYITFSIVFFVCGLLNIGWSRFAVEKDPVNLWVANGSANQQTKEFFDKNFGPFYRTQQIIVNVHPDYANDDDSVFNWNRLQWWAGVENDIRQLTGPSGVTLGNVCLAPTAQEHLKNSDLCVVQSWMGYISNSLDNIDERNWKRVLDGCSKSPASCLPPSGQPLGPRFIFGGIPGYSNDYSLEKVDIINIEESSEEDILAHKAKAFIVTFVLRNSLDPAEVAKAEEWERELRDFLFDLVERAPKEAGLQINFSTEISLEEELNKTTNTDIRTVVLSYLLMFLYVALNLGKSGSTMLKILTISVQWIYYQTPISRWMPTHDSHRTRARSTSISQSITESLHDGEESLLHGLLVESKFLLALFGIAIVLLSVSTAIALFSLFGIKVTLIIAEVIPFLVLAIGVDNVFILAHEVDKQTLKAISEIRHNGEIPRLHDRSSDTIMHGREWNEADLSDLRDEDMIMSSAEERVAQALSRMGPSILLSACCETVAFALGALVGMPAVRNFAIYAAGAVVINTLLQITVFVSAMVLDLKRQESRRIDFLWCFKFPTMLTQGSLLNKKDSVITKFIKNYYAPFIVSYPVKIAVLVIFSALFVASWVGSSFIEMGLDQRLALPTDSYLIDYFNGVDTYLDVGAPVYFIEKNVPSQTRKGQLRLCGRFTPCYDYSIANTLEAERKRPESSFLIEPPSVWIDDFFQWLNPDLETCCRVDKRNPERFCSSNDSDFRCRPCFAEGNDIWNITMEGFPEHEEFMRYLKQWLISPSDESCPLGGKAAYSDALSLSKNHIEASHFRTFHKPLKSQADYINALKSATKIAENLSHRNRADIAPYSIFYVFFDQYLHIKAQSREVILLALLVVYVISSVFLGSWRTAACVITAVALSVVNMLGIMGAWRVNLNAISLVNLVISVGISVEFCSHLARSFMGALGGGLPYSHPAGLEERNERVQTALIDVGPSIFSGITVTKLIGVAVLALTRSKLLEVYYFRMWLSLIISGALHGLVFLPVLLSLQGGQGYAIEREDEDLTRSAIQSYETRPFLADDSDDDSSITNHHY